MTGRSDDALARLRETKGIIEELIADWAEWDARTRAWMSRGYPASVRPDGSRTTNIADPTYAAVLTIDPIAEGRGEQFARTSELLGIAREMDRNRLSIMLLAGDKAAPEYRGIAHCANIHGCPDDGWSTKAGRCNACYAYRYRTGRDRRKP